MKKRSFLLGVILILFLTIPGYAVTFNYATVDFPGASHTFLTGINDSGSVVGNYNYSYDNFYSYAFVGKVGNLTPLGISGVNLWDINERGDIVGVEGYRGFIQKKGSYYTSFTVPGYFTTQAYGINTSGSIVGTTIISGGFLSSGYTGLSGKAPTYTPINFPSGSLSSPYGINDKGEIVGYYYDSSGKPRSFLYDGTIWTTLDYPGAETTLAYDINDLGQIVGSYFDGQAHGFLYDGITWTSLDYPGGYGTLAYDINNQGQIVGAYNDRQHGFIASPIRENQYIFMATPSQFMATPSQTPIPPTVWLLGSTLLGLSIWRGFRKI